MKRFELTDLAADALAQLEAEGIRPTPQDVLRVQALSLKACGAGSLLKGTPRSVGGHTFWPLTIGASCWFGDFIDWLDGNGDRAGWDFYAFAYASAHSRDRREPGKPFAFDCAGEVALDAVRKWKRSLCITEPELLDAVEGTMAETVKVRGLNADDEDDEDCAEVAGQRFDRSDLAQMLVSLVGGTLDEWMWTADIPTAAATASAAIDQKARERGLPAKNADDTIAGLKALSLYCAEIRARAKPKGSGNGAES